jgi:hypothetical protein
MLKKERKNYFNVFNLYNKNIYKVHTRNNIGKSKQIKLQDKATTEKEN